MPVIGMLGPLAEIDDDVVAKTNLHGLVAGLDHPIDQQDGFGGPSKQTTDHALIVEHVAIHHQDGRTGCEHGLLSPERYQTSFAVTRILHETDAPIESQSAHHVRSEEHTSELQSLMRSSYAVFCLKKK